MLKTTQIPFPNTLPGLTSLRFFAVLYVVLFHYHLKIHPFFDAIIAKGYLAVDFFFILSGFILTHCYLLQIQEARFSYKDFLIRRLARIYPVHLATLLLTALLFGIGLIMGMQGLEQALKLPSFIHNVFLVHAWGLSDKMTYNRYSWSISAEFFAYLAFPFLLKWCLKFNRIGLLLISYSLLAIMWTASEPMLAVPFTKMTTNGAYRIIPEFLIGMSLYLFAMKHKLTVKGDYTLIGSLLAVAISITLLESDFLVVLIFSFLVLFTAEQTRQEQKSVLSNSFCIYLGEISYSLYMLQYPFMFGVFALTLEQILKFHNTSFLWNYLWGIAPIILILLAMLTHKYIEHPARSLVVKYFEGKQNKKINNK